ncbi:MAG: GNAT family N-acetyltransferase [Roseiflexaceae bacterium]
MAHITLHTERLLLTTLNADAAPQVLDYLLRNQEFVRPWNPAADPEFFTLEAQQDRLRREQMLRLSQSGYRFWMFERDDTGHTRVLGDVALSNIVWGAFLSCHLGYKIDQQAGGKGYMTEAVRAVVGYAFDTLRLHRVEANIMPRNTRSLRVVEKLGFEHEGLSRAYLKINGVWEDHLHYVLLSPHDV